MTSNISLWVSVNGDPELARLLASASSVGWDGLNDLDTVAKRCQWPGSLCEKVRSFRFDEVERLVQGSGSLLRVFTSVEARVNELRLFITGAKLQVADDGELIALIGGKPDAILLAAALGLTQVIGQHGDSALRACASCTCTQPVLRVGSRARSNACSLPCANRARVQRHRAARRVAPFT